jgi:hypothetical protein
LHYFQALQYVKNFANGSGQWQGFPIKVQDTFKK